MCWSELRLQQNSPDIPAQLSHDCEWQKRKERKEKGVTDHGLPCRIAERMQ